MSGYAVDALIINGTVNVYAYGTGVQGVLLGTATTDNHGYYQLPIQAPSQPVELTVTGGYYFEEASGDEIPLQSGQQLRAYANYVSGQPLTLIATSYTNLAAGLAKFKMNHGIPVAQAIDDANTEVSNLIGVNIITTRPLNITNIGNATTWLNPGLQYGFFEAALSEWTYTEALQNGTTQGGNGTGPSPYTSIAFAQEMYNDVVSDGVLDGRGQDQYGPENPLSLGSVKLGTDTYRHELAVSMVRMAGQAAGTDANNTGQPTGNYTKLPSAALTTPAQSYNNSTDPLFNGQNPLAFAQSANPLTFSLPPWGRGSITVTANIQDAFGFPAGLTLQIDQGTPVVAGAQNLSVSATTASTVNQSATWPIDTTQYGPDAYHTLTIAGTDAAGYAFTLQQPLGFDNVPPTVCYPSQPSNLAVTDLAIADDLSGPGSLSMNGVGFSDTTAVHGGWHLWEGPLSRPQPMLVGPVVVVSNPLPITAADQAGNVLNTSSTSAPSCGF